MKAGALPERLTIERFAGTGRNDLGEAVETWTALRQMRAQLAEQTDGESAEGAGDVAATNLTFRMRYVAGVTVADRIAYAGRAFDILEIRELGRRGGLEIRCTARGLS